MKKILINLFKKMFLEKEIKAILRVLNELDFDFEFKKYSSFKNIKKNAEIIVIKNKEEIKKIMVRDNISPRGVAWAWINNISGDMLESGQYHLYRGILNPVGSGNELLQIFDISTDKLVEVGDIDKSQAIEHKKNIRNRISSVG